MNIRKRKFKQPLRETRMYITFLQLPLCGNAFLKLTYPQRLRSHGNSDSHRVSATSRFDGHTIVRWISGE